MIELGRVAKIRKLPIPVTFTLKVDGLLVTVKNRRIASIAAGRAEPSLTVKVEGVTLFEEKLPTINLPLEVKTEPEEPHAA